jgi:hypothetical protein
MLTETQPSEKDNGNCHVLADNYWEIPSMAVGQPLGTARSARRV